jgi:hypothetical protein
MNQYTKKIVVLELNALANAFILYTMIIAQMPLKCTQSERIYISPEALERMLKGVSKTKLVPRYKSIIISIIAFSACGILWEYQKLKYDKKIQQYIQALKKDRNELQALKNENQKKTRIIEDQEIAIENQKKQIEEEQNINNQKQVEVENLNYKLSILSIENQKNIKFIEILNIENNASKESLKIKNQKNSELQLEINMLNYKIILQKMKIENQNSSIKTLQEKVKKHNEIYINQFIQNENNSESLATKYINKSISYIKQGTQDNQENQKPNDTETAGFPILYHHPLILNNSYFNIQSTNSAKKIDYTKMFFPFTQIMPQHLLNNELVLTNIFLRMLKATKKLIK